MDHNSLERFLSAQEYDYARALSEVKNGRKVSHWMWYIFPQLRGLGRSANSYHYGIDGIEEARAYLAHPVLSARLTEACEAILMHEGKDADAILGNIDAKKLRSSMTLFARVGGDGSVFRRVLDRFFGGREDALTLKLLGEA